MKNILSLLVTIILWSSIGRGESLIYHNDFNGSSLPLGFNYASPGWTVSDGALVGTGSIVLDGPPPVWDCPSSTGSVVPVLCQCVANCGTQYQRISAIAVKGDLATPPRHAVRTGFKMPLGVGGLMKTCMNPNPAPPPTPMVLLDYVNLRNYKWVQFYPSYDCATQKTYLYCVIGQTVAGARSNAAWGRCAELDETDGRAAVAMQINGGSLRLFVNGQRAQGFVFSDGINSGKVGLMNEQTHGAAFEYLTVQGLP